MDEYQELRKHGITPEQEILTRQLSYFGPAPEGLSKQINSEVWSTALQGASSMAEEAAREEPGRRFEQWRQDFGPQAQSMISAMTNQP